MNWYCNKCKKIHTENELCPRIKDQLKKNPQLLTEIVDVTTLAGEHELITKQTLDGVAQGINKLAGTNLSYEGTKQFARDIQVFKRLAEERYCRKGYFNTPTAAQNYIKNGTPSQLNNLKTNLNGMGQEIDYIREEQGKLRSLFYKSKLYYKNKAGVDGYTVNRFTGKEITRTTVKAAESKSGLNTNVQGIVKALKNGDLKENEIVYGVKGTKDALYNKLDKEIEYALSQNDKELAQKLSLAKQQLKIKEHGEFQSIKNSTQRLEAKIMNGEAMNKVTAKQLGEKMAQGAIVGAAVGVTISSITNYIRYKNGELTEKEAFREISEDVLKSTVIGAGMSTVTIFLPIGAIGFISGMAIGIYFNKVCTNILDEIYGKGAYGAILDASGYIYGMTFNLAKYYEQIECNNQKIQNNIEEANNIQEEIDNNFITFESMKGDQL